MARIKVAAPCKINLHLSVGERRADGYHNVESIFQTLDFGDTLDIELVEEPRRGAGGRCDILVDSRLPGAGFQIPPEENILSRAVSLFRLRTGFDQGVRVILEKRVPPGGGLGGGSSDAAAALAALDGLAGTGLSLAELRELALDLGSDVPFFLAEPAGGAEDSPGPPVSGGAAWVSGRGERILPLETAGPWPVVLVNPGFPSPTGEAFRRLDAWRAQVGPGRGDPWPGGSPEPGNREALIQALGADPRDWPYWNDFLPALCAENGEEAQAYRRVIAALRRGGAGFIGLSGAGSTCFGVFNDGGTAEQAAKVLSDDWNFVSNAFFLARSKVRVLEY
jgi:4-diphosphocytidyl-2-C-methyl-D-erythritol kinase